MIYENNYYYAGTDAILYNIELDKLGCIIDDQTGWTRFSRSFSEVGVEIAEQSSGNSPTRHVILTSSSPITDTYCTVGSDLDVGFSAGRSDIPNRNRNRVIPIRIVFKNLTPGATYNIHSYYIEDGNFETFNACTVTTMLHGDIMYQCTDVIKAQSSISDTSVQLLKNNLNKACEIYNSMTAFIMASSDNDYLGSRTGGSFTATIDATLPSGADSSMRFRPSSSLSTCMHEMAHNLMYPRFLRDTRLVVKFMEFAAYAENANWAWIGYHNYPVISSEQYNEVMNYFVAAACYVCRAAGGKI